MERTDNEFVIERIETDEELQKYWKIRDEYMVRDVFPDASFGPPLTETDKEWFFSEKYRNTVTAISKRDIDRFNFVFLKMNNDIVGFADYGTYLSEDGKCFIVDFCILPEFRNKGLGGKYFTMIKLMEVEKGAKYFELNVSNDRNKHFWEMQGFMFDGYDEYGAMLMKMLF